MEVEISVESKRGCGWRHSGNDGVGLYLMGSGIWEACERLPFPLTVCPCCGAGIKFSRGFTWIDPVELFHDGAEPICHHHNPEYGISSVSDGHAHTACPLCYPYDVAGERAGLMWVGDRYYSPQSFAREAAERGISKRIASVPNDFVFGEHFVFLAHIKAVSDLSQWQIGQEIKCTPGVFMVFKPSHVDLVIDDATRVPEKAQRLAEQLGEHARLVKVIKDEAQTRSLFGEEEE